MFDTDGCDVTAFFIDKYVDFLNMPLIWKQDDQVNIKASYACNIFHNRPYF